MEKLKQEWFCPTCVVGLEKGMSREELKKQAEIKRLQIEEEEEKAKLQEKLNKSKTNAKPKAATRAKEPAPKSRSRSESGGSSSSCKNVHTPVKSHDNSLKSVRNKDRKSVKGESFEKELKEQEKLKKLIRASKKDLNQKKEKILKLKVQSNEEEMSIDQSEQSSNNIDIHPSFNNVNSCDEFSKVVVINKSKTDNVQKKKHKSEIVDQSLNDLFKAEPVLMRSLSTSSTSSMVPSSPRQRKSSSSIDSRRASSSSITSSLPVKELLCASGCGKAIKYSSHEQLHTIYCNNSCIQNHVNEMLKIWRSKRSKEQINSTPTKHMKIDLINRRNSKTLNGKDAISDKCVLEFIIKNPTYEIAKPNVSTNCTNNSNILKTPPSSTKSTSKPSTELKRTHSTPGNSTTKLERSTSVSDKSDDVNRRKFVRNALKEIFNSR